jgi:hypothetical protein
VATPVYASATNLRDWTGRDSTSLTDADANRALVLAERDVDSLSPVSRPLDATTGRRFDVTALSSLETLVLQRATCAQAEYRLSMGEDFFVRGQYAQVDGPDFKTVGKLPRIAPGVWQELAGTGLIRFATTTGSALVRNRRAEPDFPIRDPRTDFERG